MAADGPGIKVPVDLSLLVNADAKMKSLRKEVKEAKKEIEDTKSAQSKAGQSVNVPTAQRSRLQSAEANLNAFKEERKTGTERSMRFREFHLLEEARRDRWHQAAASGDAVRSSAWDYAMEAGAAAQRGNAARALVEQQGKAIIYNRNRAQIRANTAYKARNGIGGDIFNEGARDTVQTLHTIRHVAHRVVHAMSAFGNEEFAPLGINPNARKTSSEYIGDRISAVGQLAILAPHPVAKAAGAAAVLVGKALEYSGSSERYEKDSLRDRRLDETQFRQGFKMPGDKAWAGFGSGVTNENSKEKARDDLAKSDVFYRIMRNQPNQKFVDYLFGEKVRARQQELMGNSQALKSEGYRMLEQGDLGMAQSLFDKANESLPGSAPRRKTMTGTLAELKADENKPQWSMPDLYMAKVLATEANRTWMRGQMRRAGNRTGG